MRAKLNIFIVRLIGFLLTISILSIHHSADLKPDIQRGISRYARIKGFITNNVQLKLVDDASGEHSGLFISRKQARHWVQAEYDIRCYGLGTGYRFLKEDSFIGVYGFGRWMRPKGFQVDEKFGWSIGGEYATRYFQGTVGGYGVSALYPTSYMQFNYQGLSGRFSLSYFEKMHRWGRLNPLAVCAYTRMSDRVGRRVP